MMIKDISISKELDRKALAEVRGGGDQTIYSTTVAQSDVHQFNFGGVQVGLDETTANSAIYASNEESSFTNFSYGYPHYWL
jgi:hypothetical protein